MEIQSQTSQLILETRSGVFWNQNSAIYFLKTILINHGTRKKLGQSTSWHALFGGFSPLAQGLNFLVAPRQKDEFLGFLKGNFLQENVCPYARGCHEGGFRTFYLFTGHGNSPPMYEMRDCRDGEKMMCNIKHV